MENLIYKLLKVFWKETENVILLFQIVPCSVLRLRKSIVLLEMVVVREGAITSVKRKEHEEKTNL